jgi:hypothetical protein
VAAVAAVELDDPEEPDPVDPDEPDPDAAAEPTTTTVPCMLGWIEQM